jgi:hypothetical protein
MRTPPKLALGLPLVLILALAILLGGETPAYAHDPPARASFTGHWETSFGELVLEKEGAFLHGTYSSGGAATLRGSVEGRKLTFRYAETGARGEGWFELSPDGASFSGKWRPDDEPEWREWKGKRAKASAPSRLRFDGLFETRYGRIRLAQTGDAVSGVYRYNGSWGNIAGKVKDGLLSFEWREAESHGSGEFRLGSKSAQIRGRWKPSGAQAWKDWHGQRVKPKPGVVWLTILEAYWEESLSQSEYSFGRMLRAYFRRYPRVQLRHRRFGDVVDFVRAAREVALLAEPVVLLVASHGSGGQLVAGKERISAKLLGQVLAGLPNLKLVHFSACEMIVGDALKQLRAKLPEGRKLPISGYAVSVDWSASAVLEFLYLDLILGRGYAPGRAARVVRQELGFSSDKGVSGSPLGGLKFRYSE